MPKAVVFVAAVAAAFLAGYAVRAPQGVAGKAERKPLYWHDPMHPAYQSDKPGIAPDCGMQLEPVYSEADAAGSAPVPSGAVRVSAEKKQLMGLRSVAVTHGGGTHQVRLLGRVAPDETRVHRVTALAEGVVRQVSPLTPGSVVKKEELLAQYFVSSSEVYSAMQNFFVAMSSRDQGIDLSNTAVSDPRTAQIRVAEELLRTFGLTETQLLELARTRKPTRDIEFRSPVTGMILLRNAALGQRVEKGTELFRVAELNRVWVLADVFESDSGLLRPGMPAEVRYRGRTLKARVSATLPQFDAASRTMKVRLEMDNPDLALRPDMFVDVEMQVKEPEGLSIPADALIDSGRRKAVFVESGEGVFEPREVTTGAAFGGRVQVVKGLAEGEKVVVTGMFLLDSESKLQLAAERQSGGTKDPICGMEVDPAKAQYRAERDGKTYYFCSKSCKEKFEASQGGQS